MQITDKSLIQAHCEGDKAAFAQLVRRYGDSIFGFLIKMCKTREQAEDLFQETFKRVHEKAHTFRGGRFKSWLFTIATHIALNSLRKNKQMKVVPLNLQTDCPDTDCGLGNTIAVADNSSNPLNSAAIAEQKQKVREAIYMLPQKQRATLVLSYYQQLSYREVAGVLGCSAGTVKTQMYRALRTLAQKLPDLAGEIK